MTLELPTDKVPTIVRECSKLLTMSEVTIQVVAQLIGKLVAAAPAVQYGLLYTRQLEIETAESLELHSYNYRAKMSLSRAANMDLQWWTRNASRCSPIRTDTHDLNKRLSFWLGSSIRYA